MIALSGYASDDALHGQGRKLSWGSACEVRDADLEAHREIRRLRGAGWGRHTTPIVELAQKIVAYRKLIDGFAEAHLVLNISKGVVYLP